MNVQAEAIERERPHVESSAVPWYREVTRDQWLAFWATFMGWVVDAFEIGRAHV